MRLYHKDLHLSGYNETQHSPSLWTRSHNIQVISKLLELDLTERLCKNVGSHIFSWDISQLDIARGNSLADEVEMNIDVFGMSMEGGILG